MNIIFELGSSAYTAALGWTLLHSLWQAALLGLVAAAGFFLLRRRSAQSRYTLGVAALSTQLLVSAATFLYYLPPSFQTTSAARYPLTGYAAHAGGPVAPLPLAAQVQLWLSAHLPELVVCWLIGVGVLLLRFAGGWLYLERLRLASRPVRESTWTARFGVLVARLDIGQSVELRETARIVTPMVVGVLQPVVLVPLGLFSGLSVAQVEAILAHELAHIRRHDYLVNLLQSLVEVMYFFHPALWWLSGRIRAEREHCCDDLAMAVCDDRLSLAHALVRVAEFRSEPDLVLAFAANRRHLLTRVRRVLGVAEPASRRPAGYLPLAVMVLSLLVGASVHAFQKTEAGEKGTSPSVSVEVHAENESINEKRSAFVLLTDTLIVEEEAVVEEEIEEVVEAEIERAVELEIARQEHLLLLENDTLREKMAEYQAKMEVLQQEMRPYQEEAEKIQQKMQPIHQKMADVHLKMEKEHFELERIQREAEKIEWKKEGLMKDRRKMLEKRSELMRSGGEETSAAEREKKMAELETQLKAKEQEITALNEKVLQTRQAMREAEKPLDALSDEIERFSREAEVHSREMEVLGEKMNAIGRKMEQLGRDMELVPPPLINYRPAPLQKAQSLLRTSRSLSGSVRTPVAPGATTLVPAPSPYPAPPAATRPHAPVAPPKVR